MRNILSDFKDGQDFVGGLVQGQAKRQAGAKLARRDYGGAAEDLYGAGMLREGAQVQEAQDQVAENQRLIEEEDRKRKLEDAKERGAFALQVSKGLAQIPLDQRDAAFETVAPAFQAMGVSEDFVDQMRRAPKDNNSLLMFGASVENELKFFSNSHGVFAADPRTGKVTQAYEAPEDPYKDELALALIEQRRAQAERARRPPAPRGGGRGMKLPSGFILD